MSTLQLTWFLVIAGMFTVYAILDGYTLGLGAWHVFTKKGLERDANINAIGPYWDASEVWLLTGGASLFAAFPPVYAAFASGFYLAVMLVIWTLIMRAVSIEFRNKVDSPKWRSRCDVMVTIGSAVPALLLGVALGNILRGIPLNEIGDYTGTFLQLLNPFSLIMGVTGLIALVMHGAVYMSAKAKDELKGKEAARAMVTWPIYLIGSIVILIWAWIAYPHLTRNFKSNALTWIAPLVFLAAMIAIPVLLKKASYLKAFIASSISLAAFMTTAAIGLFPNLIPASNAPELSLGIANASSSEKTLMAMLIIAAIGMPIVLIYTIYMHWLIEKKMRIQEEVY